MPRVILLVLLLSVVNAGAGETIDGIAATIDDQVITTSDLDRIEAVFLVPLLENENRTEYRKRLLQHQIDRLLQRRDIRRFSTIEVDPARVERWVDTFASLHGSREEFDRVISSLGMTMDDVRAIIAAEFEVRTYIDERFAPMVFVPLEEVQQYYKGPWTEAQQRAGVPVQPFAEVRESLRDILRAEQLQAEVDNWTRELRARANIDVFVFR